MNNKQSLASRPGILCLCVTLVLGGGSLENAIAQHATHVVIGELYGGGGNAGSTFRNDYIELYNPTDTDITMTDWSVQYATSGGLFTAGKLSRFSGLIPAHGFFLIQEAQGAGGSANLPAPDASDTINLSATSGKLALAGDTNLVTAPDGANVLDFVGYGSANQFEGAGAVGALSNTSSAERKAQQTSTISSMSDGGADSLHGNGFDSGSNVDDFVLRTVQIPQNSSSPREAPPAGPPPPPPPATHIVISEIYGGGGNSGASFKNDFVELYNPTSGPVAMTHWSLQYATPAGSFSAGGRTRISGIIPSYGFYLIREAQGAGGTIDLPAPDDTGTVNLGAAGGKVALVGDTILIAGPSSLSVVDFAGYGSASQFEGGGPAGSLSNTTSAERKARITSTAASMHGSDSLSGNGLDTGNNDADFIIRNPPDPQNSSSPPEPPGGGSAITLGYSVRAGWNMVSLDLSVSDPRKSALFPTAVSRAFRYSGGYVTDDSIRRSYGYWIKFPSDEIDSVAGLSQPAGSIELAQGWNMIGAPVAPVAGIDLVQQPPGIVVSKFFGYSGGYVVSDTLFPTHAYWIKSSAPGKLFFSQGIASKTCGGSAVREFNSLTISDQTGHHQCLYFDAHPDSSLPLFQMPPRAPEGAFDARFASGQMLEAAGEMREVPILVSSEAYPLLVEWKLNDASVTASLLNGDSVFPMRNGGAVKIDGGTPGLRLRFSPAALDRLPDGFDLGQNYPNPFNPGTSFRIAVPGESRVDLAVYDILGCKVRSLLHGLTAGGSHPIEWDGRNDQGLPARSGVYVVRMTSGRFSAAKKIILVK
jgi:hypothetical protein